MKTLRMKGKAFLTVLMCVLFASCENDEDLTKGGSESLTNGKNLVKIAAVSEDGSSEYLVSFVYDDKGRLISATETKEYNNSAYVVNFQYVWGDDVIKVFSKGSNGIYTQTLKLNNRLVQSEEYVSEWYESTYTYSYNSSKRLSEYADEDYEISCVWDGDKLKSVSDKNSDDILTYGKSCGKGYFPFVVFFTDLNSPLLMAHPEIVGARTTQLPVSDVYTYHGNESKTTTYDYEFDKEGYISRFVRRRGNSTYVYDLTWE